MKRKTGSWEKMLLVVMMMLNSSSPKGDLHGTLYSSDTPLSCSSLFYGSARCLMRKVGLHPKISSQTPSGQQFRRISMAVNIVRRGVTGKRVQETASLEQIVSRTTMFLGQDEPEAWGILFNEDHWQHRMPRRETKSQPQEFVIPFRRFGDHAPPPPQRPLRAHRTRCSRVDVATGLASFEQAFRHDSLSRRSPG